MTIERLTHSRKLKTNTRGLDIIQEVFTFAMALGLSEVFIGSKTFLGIVLFRGEAVDDGRGLLTFLLFANVLLLGLRFFWVPRNLGALVFIAARNMVADAGDHTKNISISNFSIALHMVMILWHGVAFYLICTEFENIVFLASSSLPLDASMFTSYILMHICLLLTNAAWISAIKAQERRLERKAGLDEDAEPPSAGSVWWLNNLLCSMIGIAPFAILGSCHYDLSRCSAQMSNAETSIQNILPGSAHQLSVLFEGLVFLLQKIGIYTSNSALLWVLGVLLLNSLFDLLTTGRHYLFFQDVEWESEIDRTGSDGAAHPEIKDSRF